MQIHDIILNHLPHKCRLTPSGWRQFNAVCCHHRGHKPDTRGRGNLRMDAAGVVYSCFNCGFKTRFDGTKLSDSFQQWLTWMNVEREQIQRIKLALLSEQMQEGTQAQQLPHAPVLNRFASVDLPPGSKSIQAWAAEGCDDPHFLHACEYLLSRGVHLAHGYDYHWCPQTDHQWNQRVLIPFWADGKCVGYTGRYAGVPPDGVSRYMNQHVPQGYLFNWDRLHDNRKFVILVEGPFDAIAVQGVASMGSTLSEQQVYNLLHCDREIVVLPDRQTTNQHLIDSAVSFGWAVSFPDWEPHIKDAADACKAYGQIYTITSALAARTTNPLTIGVKRKWITG